jgi:hypothetical protein
MIEEMSLQLGNSFEDHTTSGESTLEPVVLKGCPERRH